MSSTDDPHAPLPSSATNGLVGSRNGLSPPAMIFPRGLILLLGVAAVVVAVVAIRATAWLVGPLPTSLNSIPGAVGGILAGFSGLLSVVVLIQWGSLAFITDFIPNVGFISGLIPQGPFENDSPTLATTTQ